MPQYEITFSGDGGVGKSAIAVQARDQNFLQIYDPTVSERYEISLVDNGQSHTMIFLENGSQGGVLSETTIQYLRDGWKRRQGFIVVTVLALGNLSRVVLVGNKKDQSASRSVTFLEGQLLAVKHGFGFLESSARSYDDVRSLLVTILRRMKTPQNVLPVHVRFRNRVRLSYDAADNYYAVVTSVLPSLNEPHIFADILLLGYVAEFQKQPEYTAEVISLLLERFAPREHQLKRLRSYAAPAEIALILSVINFHCSPCDVDRTRSYSINHLGDFMTGRLVTDFMFRWLLDRITAAFLKIVCVRNNTEASSICTFLFRNWGTNGKAIEESEDEIAEVYWLRRLEYLDH